jgi:hypothetical protein
MTLRRKQIMDELARRLAVSFPDVVFHRNLVGQLMENILKRTPAIGLSEDIEKSKIISPGTYEKELTVIIDYFGSSIDALEDMSDVMEEIYNAVELDLRFKKDGNGSDLVMSYGMVENSLAYYSDPNEAFNITIVYVFTYKENSPGVSSRGYLRRPS